VMTPWSLRSALSGSAMDVAVWMSLAWSSRIYPIDADFTAALANQQD
jgi:hypothetical protein